MNGVSSVKNAPKSAIAVHSSPMIVPSRLAPDLHEVDLVAAVDRGAHVLRARLGPLDRAADLARRPRREDLLRVVGDLHAEAAADVGRDDADAVLAHLELAGHEQPDQVRVLARQVQRRAGRRGSRRCRRAARSACRPMRWLTIRRSITTSDSAHAASMSPPPIVHSWTWLVPRSAWTSVSVSLIAFSGSTTTGQRLVLDEHLLGGVDDAVLVVAEHDRDALADVLDLVLGERPVLGRLDLDARRHPRHRQAGRRCRGPRR